MEEKMMEVPYDIDTTLGLDVQDAEIVEEVKKKSDKEEKLEMMQEMFQNEDFRNMWIKMHTPWERRHKKVGRNDICPFCDSGKKYKNCSCYEREETDPYTTRRG